MNPSDFEWRVYEGVRLPEWSLDERDNVVVDDGPQLLPNIHVQLRCNLDEAYWFSFAPAVVGLCFDLDQPEKEKGFQAEWCPAPDGRSLDTGTATISRFE